MVVHEIFFSPTGNTKAIVSMVGEALGERGIRVDLSDPAADFSQFSFGAGDACLIGVPSFGGRVPAPALERLRSLDGGQAQAVLVVTYGNRAYEDTLLELADAAKESGFHVAAAVAAVAEHSIMHQFATGRPDDQDKASIRAFSERIAEALRGNEPLDEPALPGSRPYRSYNGVPFKPKAGKACTSCGLCAERCPVGAIPAATPKKTDEKLCISCMRCIDICPQGARTLNKAMLLVAGKKMASAFAERKEAELFLA